MTDFEALLSDLEEAFPSTMPPEPIRLVSDDMDHDTVYYVKELLQVPWRELPRRMVAEHCDCALALSIERYFAVFPAYLDAYVYYLWHEDPYCSTIESVFRHIPWRNSDPSIFSLSTDIQREVIARSLIAAIELHEAWRQPGTKYSPEPLQVVRQVKVWVCHSDRAAR